MTPPSKCEWFPRHAPIVVYSRRARDWFRRRFWVVCFRCDLHDGPFLTKQQALASLRAMETLPYRTIGAEP